MGLSRIEHLLIFFKEKFPFIHFKTLEGADSYQEEKIGLFIVSEKKMYIIDCNGCYFVAEAEAEYTLSTPPRHSIKRIKTDMFYSKIPEESEDWEEFEEIDSKKQML